LICIYLNICYKGGGGSHRLHAFIEVN
jgi:hypothetical protein